MDGTSTPILVADVLPLSFYIFMFTEEHHDNRRLFLGVHRGARGLYHITNKEKPQSCRDLSPTKKEETGSVRGLLSLGVLTLSFH